MEFHPLANQFPLMTDDQLKELAASIRANGLRNAIWLYEGKILDGRNRYRACILAEVEPVYQEYEDDDAETFVIVQNLDRLHYTREQRAELVGKMRAKGMSYREIAGKLKVGQQTAMRDAKEAGVPFGTPAPSPAQPNRQEETPVPKQPPQSPAKVTGKDGKQYPAARPAADRPPPKPRAKAGGSKTYFDDAAFTELYERTVALAASWEAYTGIRALAKEWQRETRWEVCETLERLAKRFFRASRDLRQP